MVGFLSPINAVIWRVDELYKTNDSNHKKNGPDMWPKHLAASNSNFYLVMERKTISDSSFEWLSDKLTFGSCSNNPWSWTPISGGIIKMFLWVAFHFSLFREGILYSTRSFPIHNGSLWPLHVEIHFRLAPFFGSRKGGGREKTKRPKRNILLSFTLIVMILNKYTHLLPKNRTSNAGRILEEYRKIGVRGKAFYKGWSTLSSLSIWII